jgi:hypothetical protein
MTDKIDTYTLGAYWGSRAEPLSDVAQKALQTLTELRDIDVQFLKYYRRANSRKKALEKGLSLDQESVKQMCVEMIKKGELGADGFAKMGFLFGVWTGQEEAESSGINFNVGHKFETPYLSNVCYIDLPYEGPASIRLLQRELSKSILGILVKIWKPDYAVLTSRHLRDKLDIGNQIGWITYRNTIKEVPRLGEGVSYERDGSGHWFFAKTIGSSIEVISKELSLIKSII